jgi:gliding motility-associated-like protein
MKSNCLCKQHRFFILALFVFIGAVAGAQGVYNTTDWKFSNPKPFGFTVLDVDFLDNNNALAVGSDGGIAKTTNGGTSWVDGIFTYNTNAGIATKATINDIHFVNSNIAYIVGDRACMAKTTDGGVTWNYVNTPYFATGRNINAVWFVTPDIGYIGGQYNSIDSIPKLYRTLNGGATWDSIAAPLGGKTRVGYINNQNAPPLIWDVDAKEKEIWRIEFTSPNTGYISGGGTNLFPRFPSVNAPTAATNPCGLTGNTTTTGSQNAALVWKFENGVLKDYSLSKERLGYSGVNTATILCNTTYGSITPQSQQYRAMNIINDSLIVLMSFNNNIVVRVRTGRADSTTNIATGLKENGRYEIMSFPFPPNSGTPIPNPNNNLFSNPYQIRRAPNGKLFASANFGLLWTSTDTGRNWVRERSLPPNQNYSGFATWASDIKPGGGIFTMGTNGVYADSSSAAGFTSNYNIVLPGGGYAEIEFADCNTAIAAGGASIITTSDGGATWTDRFRADFQALNISINGLAFPFPNKSYFVTSVGTLYRSPDRGVTMDPVYSNNLFQFQDVSAIGQDSIWVVASSSFSVPAANRTSSIFRSFNNGATWQTIGGFPVGTTAPVLSKIYFPSRQVGYIAGSRGAIYKTTDAGATWTNISPFPALTPQLTYTEVYAVDDNTVFACGNGFPRKAVYKSTDGGATWTDITSNITTIYPVGNLNGVLFHDANNGYVVGPGGALLRTTDGGTSWTLHLAASNILTETMAFAPKTVPAGITMPNRKLFVTGFGLQSTGILEFGNPANINVNATETITNASCTNPAGGSITINATGAIAPYTYSINGGPFQTSNTFTGLTQGPKTITIKDAFCGTLTKTVTVGFNDNLTLSVNNDTLVCAGAPVQMLATSAATAYVWSPATGLSNASISNPVATVNNNTSYTVTASLNGCVRTRTVNINIKPNPIISAGPDKTIIDGDQVTLEGSAPANSVSIAWTPNTTLTGAGTLFPVAKPNITTNYTLTVRNSDGCTSTDNALVTVVPYCVKVMNAFTPNGDGVNDRWIVTTGSCAAQVQAIVYNRYGNAVYKNDNYQNNWDGTYNGKPVPDGTYYYAVTYRLITGRVVLMKGDVTILR